MSAQLPADLPVCEQQWTFSGHRKTVYCVTELDGCIFTGCGDHKVRQFSLTTGNLVRTLSGHTGSVACLVPTSLPHDAAAGGGGGGDDGAGAIISGSHDKTLKMWDAKTGRSVRTFKKGHAGHVYCAAVAGATRRLFSGSADGIVVEWALDTGAIVRTLKGHSDWVRAIVMHPAAARLPSAMYSCSNDKTIRLWRLGPSACADTMSVASVDGECLSNGDSSSIATLPQRIFQLAISLDHKRIFAAASDKLLHSFVLDTGAPLRQYAGHAGPVLCVACLHDGVHVVTGSGDKTLRLWNIETGQCVAALRTHRDWIRDVIVLPSVSAQPATGMHRSAMPEIHRLVSVSDDATAVVWNVALTLDPSPAEQPLFRSQGLDNRILSRSQASLPSLESVPEAAPIAAAPAAAAAAPLAIGAARASLASATSPTPLGGGNDMLLGADAVAAASEIAGLRAQLEHAQRVIALQRMELAENAANAATTSAAGAVGTSERAGAEAGAGAGVGGGAGGTVAVAGGLSAAAWARKAARLRQGVLHARRCLAAAENAVHALYGELGMNEAGSPAPLDDLGSASSLSLPLSLGEGGKEPLGECGRSDGEHVKADVPPALSRRSSSGDFRDSAVAADFAMGDAV